MPVMMMLMLLDHSRKGRRGIDIEAFTIASLIAVMTVIIIGGVLFLTK
jgi:predicted nucleic acid-binding Zn ribbon protein